MKHIATCGHEVDEGISASVLGDVPNSVKYGTWCSGCLREYYKAGQLMNGELIKFNERIDYDKKRIDQLENLLIEACKIVELVYKCDALYLYNSEIEKLLNNPVVKLLLNMSDSDVSREGE